MTEQLQHRLAGFLGLCGRAGQITLGQDACVAAVRSETAALVLIDEGSAPTTMKRFTDSCFSHQVPLYGVPCGLISQALGKDGRMTVAVRAGSMATKLVALLAEETPIHGRAPNPEERQTQEDLKKHSANQCGGASCK